MIMKNWYKPISLNPPQMLAIIFFTLVFAGGLLLKLPMATEKGVTWVDAFFTAASAATVTGLATIDPGSTFTLFGEIVILFLMQLGGLGIMTFTVLVMIMLGKRIGIRQRLIMQEALNQPSVGGVVRLVRKILIFTFTVQIISVIILSLRWIPDLGIGKGIYYAIFHTIAAFNNAGFSLWPDNLSRYVHDPTVNIMITSLIIVGGLGFTVIFDLVTVKNFKKISLHSKVMLLSTLVVNLLAFLFILLAEFHNPNTLGKLDFPSKLWASYFQAITTRTAGFNTIDIGSLEPGTALFMMFLMFVGAGSTSTGGGIKLTTFVIISAAVITFLKGKQETNILHRRIRDEAIIRSLAITTVSILFIFLVTIVLAISEKGTFLQILFEVISAFGTVGLSMNFTSSLSILGKIIVILIMFFGKLGPLTLVYSFTKREKSKLSYPTGELYT
ncbi:MAG: Trk-type transport system, rane component [Bacillus sp. (in: firmicutes)]|nr:Trk-type transport system, rane component [Bacillus sp. (in: firmicutes)]